MEILQMIYDLECNFYIKCFWDGGIDWGLGDEQNGYYATGTSDTVEEAIKRLSEMAHKCLPIVTSE